MDYFLKHLMFTARASHRFQWSFPTDDEFEVDAYFPGFSGIITFGFDVDWARQKFYLERIYMDGAILPHDVAIEFMRLLYSSMDESWTHHKKLFGTSAPPPPPREAAGCGGCVLSASPLLLAAALLFYFLAP